MIKHMKERYAFRYNEFLQQQKETGKIFASDNCLNALLCDVDCRYKGKEFINGNAAFSKLGVRVNGNLNLTGNLDFLTDTYGADAVRIALIEELPLFEEPLLLVELDELEELLELEDVLEPPRFLVTLLARSPSLE